MEKIVIIGGVAAGATAAAKARRLSADAQITILESGPDIFFCQLRLALLHWWRYQEPLQADPAESGELQ